jgi:imidazoleglycerol phosphate synthase glutamine amidotransferase subunit HisH
MVDLIHPSNNVETLNAGIEFNFLRFLSIRAGYQSLFNDSSENGLTFGVGIFSDSKGKFPLGIHYTYSAWGILNDVHRFSIDWSIAN